MTDFEKIDPELQLRHRDRVVLVNGGHSIQNRAPVSGHLSADSIFRPGVRHSAGRLSIGAARIPGWCDGIVAGFSESLAYHPDRGRTQSTHLLSRPVRRL